MRKKNEWSRYLIENRTRNILCISCGPNKIWQFLIEFRYLSSIKRCNWIFYSFLFVFLIKSQELLSLFFLFLLLVLSKINVFMRFETLQRVTLYIGRSHLFRWKGSSHPRIFLPKVKDGDGKRTKRIFLKLEIGSLFQSRVQAHIYELISRASRYPVNSRKEDRKESI